MDPEQKHIELIDPDILALFKIVPNLLENIVMYQGEPLRLEPWQFAMIGAANQKEVSEKARQIGWSFAEALKKMGRALLLPPKSYNGVFVSYNQKEAMQKIRYVKELLDGIPRNKRKELVKDNDQELEFSNGNRIESLPARAVRGGHHVDLTMDEVAHTKDAKIIFDGSSYSTIHGSYGVSLGSTHFGLGFFSEVTEGAGKPGEYQNFYKRFLPWWVSRFLCKNPEDAIVHAPHMTTQDRVYHYGTPKLIEEFEGHSLEQFQMEMEGKLIDVANAALSVDLIQRQSRGDLPIEVLEIDATKSEIQIFEMLNIALKNVMSHGMNTCAIGYDVGRVRHASEIIVVAPHDATSVCTRFMFTLRKAKFPIQEQVIRVLMSSLPVRKLSIDAQGLGLQLAEWAEQEYGMDRVFRMSFNISSKEDMVTNLIRFFESSNLWIYPSRRLYSQLLSVKKVGSKSGKLIYTADSQKEGPSGEYVSHADLFWALALAVWGYADLMKKPLETTTRSPFLRGGRGPMLGRRR